MIDLLVKIGIPRHYAGDVWLVLLFVLISLIFLAVVKKRNLGAFLLSVYVAYGIVSKSFFGFLDSPSWKFLYFIGLILMIFLFFRTFLHVDLDEGKPVFDWLKILLFSFSAVALLSSIVMSWFSASTVSEIFSPVSLKLFRTVLAQWIWMLAPVVLIFFFKYRR